MRARTDPTQQGFERPSPVPTFLLVGAFKSGTTALYAYLGQHPDVFLSPRKEPGFFASELRAERSAGRVLDWEDYLALFRGARPGQQIGEGSVVYLWSKTAAHDVRLRLPDARVLMILRNPADRAFSQYHAAPYDPDRPSFGEAIREAAKGPLPFRPLDPFLEFGAYAAQVERWLERFPRERVGIWLHDDFVRSPETVVREVFGFLEVAPDVPLDLSRRHNESRLPRYPRLEPLLGALTRGLGGVLRGQARQLAARARWRPASSQRMTQDDRRFLIDYYAGDVRRLESLIDRDLSAWLDAG